MADRACKERRCRNPGRGGQRDVFVCVVRFFGDGVCFLRRKLSPPVDAGGCFLFSCSCGGRKFLNYYIVLLHTVVWYPKACSSGLLLFADVPEIFLYGTLILRTAVSMFPERELF